MTRPIIGVVLDECLSPLNDGSGFSRRAFYALRMDYFTAIDAAGGCGIAVPYQGGCIEKFIGMCNAWVLPGGDYRFSPEWYRVQPQEFGSSLRRSFEVDLAKAVLNARRPVLGICNGMQVLAGVSGGRLSYGIPAGGNICHKSDDGAMAAHDVAIRPGTKLAQIVRSSRIKTNSSHREAVVSIGSSTVCSGSADDGTIEAIELLDHPFAIGVQWHPEIGEDEYSKMLFRALVQAARN